MFVYFCHQQGHAGSKTLLQQNPPIVMCNGHKTMVLVAVIVYWFTAK